MFAILEEQAGGFRSWRARSGPGCTSQGMWLNNLPPSQYYADRSNAEDDAKWFRAQNARQVERTKRKRKYKTLPATYTVLEVEKVGPLPAVDQRASYSALRDQEAQQ